MTTSTHPSTSEPLPLAISCLTKGNPSVRTVHGLNEATRDLGVPHYYIAGRLYLDDGRNDMIFKFKEEMFDGYDYLLMVDDDVEFTAENVRDLYTAAALSGAKWASGQYMNVDGRKGMIVCAYHLNAADPSEHETLAVFEDGTFFDPIPLIERPDHSIYVDAVGAGFMLLHRDVIEEMESHFPLPSPWFDEPVIRGISEARPIHVGEDLGFALKMHAMGYQCLLAPVRVTHHKTIGLTIPEFGTLPQDRARRDARTGVSSAGVVDVPQPAGA